MFSCRFYLFCLVGILYICLCVGNSNVNKCVETERQALLKFKAGLIDENDSLSSWSGEDCCKWEGITCDNSTGHVIGLDLEGQVNTTTHNLTGLIDKIDSSLCELQHLTSLDLSSNYLEGKIPKCIGSLGQLIELTLAGNRLASVIPHALGNLSNLQILDLSQNDFLVSNDLEWVSHLFNLRYLNMKRNNLSQAIDWLSSISKLPSLSSIILDDCGLPQFNPKSIPQMNSSAFLETLHLSGNYLNSSTLSWVLNFSKILTTLHLSDNELEGSIPHFCSGQNSIQFLDLSRNQLNGTLPYTIGQLSNLIRLYVDSNKLTGVVNEAHLSNLSNLDIMNVDQNSLTFNLSSNWVPPFQLSELYASSCILGPNFPSWLKHQRGLFFLDISNSGISGSFPKWFWDLSTTLVYLNVSHNKLGGALPKSILQYDFVLPAEWDLSFNKFFGPLPHFLSPSLGLLRVSNNMFSGSISSFCATSYPYLDYLDLSSNFLEGPLPDCWGQFHILRVLNLATNNFSGRIPESIGTLQQIETIHLNDNNFSGEVPSLTDCSNLKFIDFGDNNLEGTLPAWVGQNLHHLIVLRLRANKFQGSIPASLCDLLHLQVLDLSKNNIIGKIPRCLDHIIALSNIKVPRVQIYFFGFVFGYEDYDKAILAWKGGNREYGKNLGFLTAIDLSCNQLTGEIPHSITTLMALASLNLSGNNLTGFIPNNIGYMKMLESFDLSRNYLYGGIPASLSNLTFLSYMNLSFNNLSGNIPVSTQLETFDAYTYIGNPRLCGPPLSKECPGDERPTDNTNGSGTKGDGDELISFGFYISLGLGFIIGFWGVCGTLALKTSWRYAYFQFFNNMYDWIYVQLFVLTARVKRRVQVQD